MKIYSAFSVLGPLMLAFFQLLTVSAQSTEEGTNATATAKAAARLQGVHRIVFLGDSITQGGNYVTDCECWLLAHGIQVEVLNLGLGSETASDLTLAENSGHLKKYGFGRPFVSERLDRVLAATKPDLLFACYGMNDGGSLPADELGTKRFADAITHLREAATRAGVKRVVICTPPVQDAKGDAQQKYHDENLARYTAWLLSKRADGWDVVDIHTPMRQALDEGRGQNAAFMFAKDGVHPGREGHWLMAREILTQFFGAQLDGVAAAEDLFSTHGTEIRKLVYDRMKLLFDAWMTQIGHKRPGVAGAPGVKPGLPLAEANAKAAEIAKRILKLIDETSTSEIWIAPDGNDAGAGTQSQPFATLERAQQAARTAAKPVTVKLRAGTYYLSQPLVLTAEDSETSFVGAPSETVVISGGMKLNLKWENYANGIMQAKVPAGLATDELFINGQRMPMARYPNVDVRQRIFNGTARDAFSRERAARWADPRGGFMHAMHNAMWGGFHYVITGKDANGNLTYVGGWQNNRPAPAHKEYRFVENIFEELDAPGEWFLDAKTSILYFYPPPGLDLTHATVEGVRLKNLIEFRGTMGHPVKSVCFRNLTIRHAARTFMETKEPLLRTDWAIYRGGAVLFNGAEDCLLEDCRLDQVGGNAIFVNNYNRRITVRGCEIVGAGANGVAFVGNPAAARNALSNYSKRNNYSEIDRTPGPQSADFPADCLVENCLIHETGRIEKQTAPVEIDLAQHITVRHCSIYDVPRAGINIGDGCWGGHIIEFCDIFNTVLETGDHGSFNSWGRDRFWGLLGVPEGEFPKLALLDAVEPIVLRNSRWRCDHGWDIDLDDGSSNYEIYNNVLLHGGLKLREGFQRRAYNNVIFNNSLHPHAWFADSGDIVKHNIFTGAYRPAAMPADLKKWGAEIDFNLFTTTEADRNRFRVKGCDLHSLVGDPLFVAAAKGDFRVNDQSPALQIGFTNFPMDQFGVLKPELRAIARTPSLALGEAEKSQRDGKIHDWRGVKLKNIVGLDEVSAYGTVGETGVLVVEISPENSLAQAGLKKGDVIVQVNELALDEFAWLEWAKDPHRIIIFRSQTLVEIKL